MSIREFRREGPAELFARLDRMPVMLPHVIWVVLLTANLSLEYYDNALFAYVIPQIMQETGLTLEEIGVVTSGFFVGMIIGALVGGRLSDRFGRRWMLVVATTVCSLGALATATADGYWLMLLARIFTGIGVQAATSALLVYIAEMFPNKVRGRVVSIVTSAFVVIAPLVGYLSLVTVPNGGPGAWRELFVYASLGLILVPLVRLIMPESVRWLASRGRIEEGHALVEKLEGRALRKGRPLAEPRRVVSDEVTELSLRQIFGAPTILKNIAIVSLAYFGTTLGLYLFSNWRVYALMDGLGYSEERAYEIVTIWGLVSAVTPLIALMLMDRFERKTLVFATSVLSAIPMAIFGIASNDWIVLVSGGTLGIITGLVVTVFYTYIPESIPTEARGLGSGIIISFGRFGGALSGVLGAAIYADFGRAGLRLVAAACYVVFTPALLFFGPRTAGRSLERVTAEELHVELEGVFVEQSAADAGR